MTHETALLQRIPARVRAYIARDVAPVLKNAKARGLLWVSLVSDKPIEIAEQPVPDFSTLQGRIGLTAEDPHRRSAIARLLPGETQLAVDLLWLALDTADMPRDCEDRRQARAWLTDHFPLYSAQVCFEACLGVEFDVVCEALTKRWKKIDEEQR